MEILSIILIGIPLAVLVGICIFGLWYETRKLYKRFVKHMKNGRKEEAFVMVFPPLMIISFLTGIVLLLLS